MEKMIVNREEIDQLIELMAAVIRSVQPRPVAAIAALEMLLTGTLASYQVVTGTDLTDQVVQGIKTGVPDTIKTIQADRRRRARCHHARQGH